MSYAYIKQDDSAKGFNKLTYETTTEISIAALAHIPVTRTKCYQKYKNTALRRQMKAYYDVQIKTNDMMRCTMGNSCDDVTTLATERKRAEELEYLMLM